MRARAARDARGMASGSRDCAAERGRGRRADDQRRLDQPHLVGAAVVDPVEQQLERQPAHLGSRLMRRWSATRAPGGRSRCCRSRRSRCRAERRRRRGPSLRAARPRPGRWRRTSRWEARAGGAARRWRCPRLLGEVAGDHQRVTPEAPLAHPAQVRRASLGPAGAAAAVDVRDPLVAEPDQVIEHQLGAVGLVDQHAVGVDAAHARARR